jgi:hypothetical protein
MIDLTSDNKLKHKQSILMAAVRFFINLSFSLLNRTYSAQFYPEVGAKQLFCYPEKWNF